MQIEPLTNVQTHKKLKVCVQGLEDGRHNNDAGMTTTCSEIVMPTFFQTMDTNAPTT